MDTLSSEKARGAERCGTTNRMEEEEGASIRLPKIRVQRPFAHKQLDATKVTAHLLSRMPSLHGLRRQRGQKCIASLPYQPSCRPEAGPACAQVFGSWNRPGGPSVQEAETHYAVSPSTPLLSTAIDDNSLICGTFRAEPPDLRLCNRPQRPQTRRPRADLYFNPFRLNGTNFSTLVLCQLSSSA